jgi:hypothetical protein
MKKIAENLAQFILPALVLSIAIGILVYKKNQEAKREIPKKDTKELLLPGEQKDTIKTKK